MGYSMALDGGGTKTLTIIFDEEFNLLGMGRSGGMNTNFETMEAVREHLAECIYTCLEAAGVNELDHFFCAGSHLGIGNADDGVGRLFDHGVIIGDVGSDGDSDAAAEIYSHHFDGAGLDVQPLEQRRHAFLPGLHREDGAIVTDVHRLTGGEIDLMAAGLGGDIDELGGDISGYALFKDDSLLLRACDDIKRVCPGGGS